MLILIIIMMRIFFPTALAGDKEKDQVTQLQVITEWIRVKNKAGITLYERWVKVSDNIKVRERKGIMVVNCQLSEARIYLSNANTTKEWMKSVSKVKQVNNGDGGKMIAHIIFNLPWPFEDRDVVVGYQVFNLDTAHSTIRLTSNNVIGEIPNIKRIKSYKATWTLEQISEERTRIELRTFSEEPAKFPLWLQDPIMIKVFYRNLQNLRGCLTDI